MRTVALVLINMACLSALLYFFDVPYRRFRLDLIRHHLFGVRDKLFAAARDGMIPFDHPAYGMARQTINGMIRFAHQISLWQFLLLVATHRLWRDAANESADYARRLSMARESLSPDGRRELDETMMCAHGIVLSHMVHTSLVTFPFVIALKFVAKTVGAFNGAVSQSEKSLPQPLLDTMDSEAYAIGEPELAYAEAA